MPSLNEYQKKMVEKYHYLINKFINDYKTITLSEHYDLLAIALCESAMQYDEDKGAFIPFACMKMKTAIIMDNRKRNTQKRGKKYKTLPLDEPLTNNSESLSLAEIQDKFFSQAVMNRISFEDDIINKITFEEYLKTLASKDKTIIDGLLANKNQNNIAHKIGCTQSYVCQRKKRLKKMWINFNNV